MRNLEKFYSFSIESRKVPASRVHIGERPEGQIKSSTHPIYVLHGRLGVRLQVLPDRLSVQTVDVSLYESVRIYFDSNVVSKSQAVMTRQDT
jgi:hypothetical protein